MQREKAKNQAGNGMDATLTMLQKNERIRDMYKRDIKRLRSDEQKSAEELDKEVSDIKKEILDMRAYQIVYRENSLQYIDAKRRVKHIRPVTTFNSSFIQTSSEVITNSERLGIKSSRKSTSKVKTKRQLPLTDPFRVRDCLLDVERDLTDDTTRNRPQTSVDSTPISPTRRPRRLRTANLVASDREEYQSLIPGNCSSYYSIRKYYEQEKDKLLHYWSPEEKRKRAVKWIVENINLPTFSVMRRETTSAIFKDFRKYKRDTPAAACVSAMTLPDIKNCQTR